MLACLRQLPLQLSCSNCAHRMGVTVNLCTIEWPHKAAYILGACNVHGGWLLEVSMPLD